MKQSLPLENHDVGQEGPKKASWYRLTISSSFPEVMIQFDNSAARIGILPLVGERTKYLLKLSRAAEIVHIFSSASQPSTELSASVTPARASDFVALAVQILRARSARNIRFTSNDLAYFIGGSDRMKRADEAALIRRYRSRNRDERLLRQLQLSDRQCAEFYPNIDDDWSCPDSLESMAPAPSTVPNDVAIYIHLFHAETWRDFCFGLQNCHFPFDLHVSLPERRVSLEAEITARFPSVQFHYFENRGRDIWPFIQLLQTGVFEPYAAVCKLHSKKSAHLHRSDTNFDIGQRWRRSAILELIGSLDRMDQIIDRFRSGESIGMVGPSNLRLAHSPDQPLENDWGTSKSWSKMKRTAGRLGIPERDLRMDFFAGTMFWFAPRALMAIAGGDFSASDFEPEPIPNEGALPHAMERMFNLIAAKAGFAVLGSRDLQGSTE